MERVGCLEAAANMMAVMMHEIVPKTIIFNSSNVVAETIKSIESSYSITDLKQEL